MAADKMLRSRETMSKIITILNCSNISLSTFPVHAYVFDIPIVVQEIRGEESKREKLISSHL